MFPGHGALTPTPPEMKRKRGRRDARAGGARRNTPTPLALRDCHGGLHGATLPCRFFPVAKACDDAHAIMRKQPPAACSKASAASAILAKLDALYPKIECPAIRKQAFRMRRQPRRAVRKCAR